MTKLQGPLASDPPSGCRGALPLSGTLGTAEARPSTDDRTLAAVPQVASISRPVAIHRAMNSWIAPHTPPRDLHVSKARTYRVHASLVLDYLALASARTGRRSCAELLNRRRRDATDVLQVARTHP